MILTHFLAFEIFAAEAAPIIVTRPPGGDDAPKARRIKRQTIHPRGPTLREMFSAQPPRMARVEAPPLPAIVTPAAPNVPIGTLAPDLTPLIDGLQSLQSALDAAALSQALEDDDAEVLMVMQ